MAAAFVFRMHDKGPGLVREVLLERGWEEYDGGKREEEDWNLYWRGSPFHSSEYQNLLPWQRLNHHPKTVGITRKDCLARHLRRMRATFGSALYDFSPAAFILPNDYTRFLAEYNKRRPSRRCSIYWICKPVDLSRGKGIFIFQDVKDLVYDCSVIVQKYISSPLLISGYKFDLRIYVCVKSFNPLTVYIHQEGLVRFATEKYSLSSLRNLYAHLTNTSINKFGPFYRTEKGSVGQGCKWTMSKFRRFIHSLDINELLLWQRISSIVTLTLLTIASSVPSCPNCVELFGFDILIDNTFKPWLLEVNYSPALTLDCQADISVKKGLIGDLIDLMNYTSTDRLRDRAYRKQRYKQPHFSANHSSRFSSSVLSKLKLHNFQRMRRSSRSSQNQTLPLPEKQNQRQTRQRVFRPDYQRQLPPIRATGTIFKTNANKSCTGPTLNRTLDPRPRTKASVMKGQTCPAFASCQMESSPRMSEVTNRDTETEAEVDLSGETDASSLTPDTQQRGQRFRRFAESWRLPNIYSGSQRPAGNGQHIPPVRVGNFIRTFPFNAATLEASQHKLDVRVITQELQKLTGLLASGRSDETEWRRDEGRRKVTDGDTCFDSLLWGPTDPPLLSQCFKPTLVDLRDHSFARKSHDITQ
ncbi:putative tubulin polyglutamylase TTLL2 [Odontesthes bonariensis]|uniref:putative tubulin polyglutamylase TTLL2 n=1 Tax=Odontesthes bonariensis TaxID=219752 RepID=UPI003F58DEDD